jgi:hypothetical protein
MTTRSNKGTSDGACTLMTLPRVNPLRFLNPRGINPIYRHKRTEVPADRRRLLLFGEMRASLVTESDTGRPALLYIAPP